MDFAAKKAALFTAHPGHVRRVYRWLEIAKPLVFVMTDGSGRNQLACLPCTTTVLENTGGRPGAIYGRWTDAWIYEAILNRDAGQFATATEELADALIGEEIDYILGDASEGCECTHELCRYMVNSAVALVEKKTGRRILNYEFVLFGPPDACPGALRDKAIRIDLDEAALARKIAAAKAYNPDFQHEVTQQLEKFGTKPFMVEFLIPADMDSEWNSSKGKPHYEVCGEALVLNQIYKDVIRYQDHFQPLVQVLRGSLGVA